MNLIFLCPAQKKVMGGVKAIYRLAETAHSCLQAQGSEALVCHPNHSGFKAKWFDASVQYRSAHFAWRWVGKPSKSKIKPNTFNPSHDVVVIPELWVRKYGTQLLQLGVPYVILVQGGYLISKGSRADLAEAYAGAKAVWCVSDDALNCVVTAFPQAKQHCYRFHLPVNATLFKPADEKKNWIAYMPRKMARHLDLIRFFVGDRLPAQWKWVPIDGLSEVQVAKVLSQSKIFLATGELEGFGLPPLEAALAGNLVIGYHGQGGKEYWGQLNFVHVESGDILEFVNQIELACQKWTDSAIQSSMEQLRLDLVRTYSTDALNADLKKLLGILNG